MLAQEPRHPAGVPERVAAEEALVDHGGVRVPDDGLGHEPALPARLCRAVGEIDVLDVVAEAAVPAAELVEHRTAHQQAGAAEQPVALRRLRRLRAVVGDLVLVGLPHAGGAAFAARPCRARRESGGATAATSRPARRRAGRRGRPADARPRSARARRSLLPPGSRQGSRRRRTRRSWPQRPRSRSPRTCAGSGSRARVRPQAPRRRCRGGSRRRPARRPAARAPAATPRARARARARRRPPRPSRERLPVDGERPLAR